MSKVLSIVLLLVTFAVKSQEPKVLFVPFQELGFVTEFELDELIYANDFGINNQTTAINDSLFYFLKNSTKHITYTAINEVEYTSIENAVQPIYKSNPIAHYGINFSALKSTSEYDKLVETYDVDFVLFVSKYHIAKRILLANQSFNGSFAIPWSNHFVDYELYDKNGELVALASKLELKPNDPKQETFEYKGLSIEEMDKGYRIFHRDIWDKMRIFEKKKKPVFKIKYKDLKWLKSP